MVKTLSASDMPLGLDTINDAKNGACQVYIHLVQPFLCVRVRHRDPVEKPSSEDSRAVLSPELLIHY